MKPFYAILVGIWLLCASACITGAMKQQIHSADGEREAILQQLENIREELRSLRATCK